MFNFFKRKKLTSIHPTAAFKPWYKRPLIWLLIVIGLVIVLTSSLGWLSFSAFSKISTSRNKNLSLIPFLNRSDQLQGESKDRVNILILGIGGSDHPGGQLSDTNILASYQPSSGKLALISIPRDLYVKIPGVGYNKLNYANAAGGPELVIKTLEPVLGQNIPYYLQLDFTAFEEVVDEIGGISVDVPVAINDPYYPAPNLIDYQPFYLAAGQQKLNGEVALKYVRSRETTSDFDRSQRQQQVIVAIKDKGTSLGVLSNPKKVIGVMSSLTKHLRINLSTKEVDRLIAIVNGLNSQKVNSFVLDNSTDGLLAADSSDVGYYLKPKSGDWKAIQAYVSSVFDEKGTKTATLPPATIAVLNGTDRVGIAAQFAKQLQADGFEVVEIGNSELINSTTIYNWGGSNRTSVVNQIKDRLGKAKIIGDAAKSSGQAADITVILGSDYPG